MVEIMQVGTVTPSLQQHLHYIVDKCKMCALILQATCLNTSILWKSLKKAHGLAEFLTNTLHTCCSTLLKIENIPNWTKIKNRKNKEQL